MSDNQKQIEQLIRQHDHDRWTCSLFAPDAARPHILALLAFNYEIARVREVVTDPAIGLIRLAWWREAADDLSRGIVRPHYALQELANIPNLDYAALHQMVDARAREFEESINPTYADFINYCQYTSGVLWKLCAAQAGAENNHVANIGQAWAMIGLLRSVMFQARFRRMYLPLDLLAQHGIDKDRFFDVPTGIDLSPVAKHIMEQAKEIIRVNTGPNNPRFINALGKLGHIYSGRFQQAKYDLLHPHLQKPLFFKYLKLLF
ncbi:MAG: hypothetical protein EYC62_01665 [Alphaproteobacteria bacterium]|nr:MAG: hypothetical protein EYC62_01665 [Alphaproteobacteria bacterium]